MTTKQAKEVQDRDSIIAALLLGVPSSLLTMWRNPRAEYGEFILMTGFHFFCAVAALGVIAGVLWVLIKVLEYFVYVLED